MTNEERGIALTHTGKSAPKVFAFHGHELRVAKVDPTGPWFVTRDVCKALGIKLTGSTLQNISDEDKGSHSMTTPGGPQELGIVNESGLYDLVFKSRKEEARAFRRWVTNEVLPSLRTTGSYSTSTAMVTTNNVGGNALSLATNGRGHASSQDALLDAGRQMVVRLRSKSLGMTPAEFLSTLVDREANEHLEGQGPATVPVRSLSALIEERRARKIEDGVRPWKTQRHLPEHEVTTWEISSKGETDGKGNRLVLRRNKAENCSRAEAVEVRASWLRTLNSVAPYPRSGKKKKKRKASKKARSAAKENGLPTLAKRLQTVMHGRTQPWSITDAIRGLKKHKGWKPKSQHLNAYVGLTLSQNKDIFERASRGFYLVKSDAPPV